MKKIIGGIFKFLVILLIIAWVYLIASDYFRVQKGKNPQYCIKETTKTYHDGTVYSCIGLGYKVFRYERKSISAFEFGPFFIQERQG